MKKAIIFLLVILAIVLGLLWYVKKGLLPLPEGETVERSETGGGGSSAHSVTITFLDIGQGDASFIQFPDGQQMLVDCAVDARILPALGRVMPYYDRRIDYLVVTHPDADHYGGCVDVLKRFDIGTIVYNGITKNGEGYWESFWSSVEREGARYEEANQLMTWDIASATLRFVYPDSPLKDQTEKPEDNNTSIVFTLTYASSSVLFTGDAEDKLEAYLLSKYKDQLNVDVLKVGHHGSDSSSIKEFIEAVSPLHAVFSVGVDNTYGHPSRRVMRRMERASSTVWRTDAQGDIIVKLDGGGVRVEAKGK